MLDEYGKVPLPPYIQHAAEKSDESRYQTVYAKYPGAVAAPTAGLHFTDELLQQIRDKGCEEVFVTLHVGAGTFQPVRVEKPLRARHAFRVVQHLSGSSRKD